MSYGLADYVDFFPCPYDQVVDAFDSIPPSAIPQPIDQGCSCGCSGGCGGMSGLGIFDSGMDLSGWGVTEWLIVAVGLYGAISLFSDTRRTVGSVRKSRRSSQARARRKKKLQEELSSL